MSAKLTLGLKTTRPDGSKKIERITAEHHIFTAQANNQYQLIDIDTGQFIADYISQIHGKSLYIYAKNKQLSEVIKFISNKPM